MDTKAAKLPFGNLRPGFVDFASVQHRTAVGRALADVEATPPGDARVALARDTLDRVGRGEIALSTASCGFVASPIMSAHIDSIAVDRLIGAAQLGPLAAGARAAQERVRSELPGPAVLFPDPMAGMLSAIASLGAQLCLGASNLKRQE